MPDPHALVDAARAGDVRSLARLISLVESGRPEHLEALHVIYPHTGQAHVIGMTGAPGAGKSTLTDQLIRHVRAHDERIAVVAVDPSSPFTGGAILGDRIRMQDHIMDRGVYIRSMGSRGHLGGMAAATPKAVTVLDGVGMPWIVVETVGVGQAEVEIVDNADTTLVVVNPGWGDSIQANKAGILEISDVFVVNKADRDGTRDTIRDLEHMLDLGAARTWRPPVIPVVATEAAGIDDVWDAVGAHRDHLVDTGRLDARRRERQARDMRRALVQEFHRRSEEGAAGEVFRSALADVVARTIDPWTSAVRLADTLD